MTVELVTKNDLHILKVELLEELKTLLLPSKDCENEWLKTNEARRILKCSNGTLQNLRIQGKLNYTKVNGTVYYNRHEILNLFDKCSL
jgi:hypothetical protein